MQKGHWHKISMMIRFIFCCLFVFSVSLNALFYMENKRLNSEVQNQFFKRLQEKFKNTEPQKNFIDKQYPIIV